MFEKLRILVVTVIGFLLLLYFLSFLISASWWTYGIIYILLIYIWYKPTLVLYHSLKAGHMLKKKNYDEVSRHYTAISEIKKNEGYGDYAKGLAYYYQKEFAQAQRLFQQALEKGIKTQKKVMEPLTTLALITTHLELKQTKTAGQLLAELEQGMEKGKKLPTKLLGIYFSLKGEYLLTQHQEEEALKAFEWGYLHYPTLIGEEAFYYAQLLVKAKQEAKAKQVLEKLTSEEEDWKFFRIRKEKAQQLLDQLS